MAALFRGLVVFAVILVIASVEGKWSLRQLVDNKGKIFMFFFSYKVFFKSFFSEERSEFIDFISSSDHATKPRQAGIPHTVRR